VPTLLGAHNARIDYARELLTKKGRRERGAFAFEGPTLIAEALESGTVVQTVYVTQQAYETTPLARAIEARGAEVYLVDERSMRRISDLETPSGIVAVSPLNLADAGELLNEPGVVLLLADLNDPGNAGTLLRSAEAFGVRRVIFGSRGAEPHHPKVVRAAMGSIFRQRFAVAEPAAIRRFLGGWEVIGLAKEGEPLDRLRWGERSLLIVGHERHGIGRWDALCTRLGAIPMLGQAESLNAAVAGSIALYEASKHPQS
jgi:TrmH family RNA methyltransferase